jgi:hypothetical protein
MTFYGLPAASLPALAPVMLPALEPTGVQDVLLKGAPLQLLLVLTSP